MNINSNANLYVLIFAVLKALLFFLQTYLTLPRGFQGLLTLTKHLQEAVDEIAPEKSVISRRKIPPWISPDLQLLLD